MTVYAWFVRGETHAAMCRTSMESVRKADSKALCFVVTDERDHKWSVDAGIVFIDPGKPIMMANLEAQIAMLFMASQWDEPVVFLDTDILMLQPVPCIGDITVTWRDYVRIKDEEKIEGVAAQMPYNYGVIVVRPNQRAIEAFIFMRERIRKMHPRFQNWYGNQLALAELAGSRPESGSQIEVRNIPWMLTDQGMQVTINKVPAEQFNYTPAKAGEDLTGKHVLHFKGNSRALMEKYAKACRVGWYIDEDPKNKPQVLDTFKIEVA